MYEHLSAYQREHLAKSSTDTILARAPEDDPEIIEEYREIMQRPGLGYDFFIENIGDLARPIWEWKLNRKLYVQVRAGSDDPNVISEDLFYGFYVGSTITRQLDDQPHNDP